MQLECLLCLAYICFDNKEWKAAEQFFKDAYVVSYEKKRSLIIFRWLKRLKSQAFQSSAYATQE